MKSKDMVGSKRGCLTILQYLAKGDVHEGVMADRASLVCQCECGHVKTIQASRMRMNAYKKFPHVKPTKDKRETTLVRGSGKKLIKIKRSSIGDVLYGNRILPFASSILKAVIWPESHLNGDTSNKQYKGMMKEKVKEYIASYKNREGKDEYYELCSEYGLPAVLIKEKHN